MDFEVYIQLFISFFKIGLFGFGGGYAILSLIQHEIEIHGWMTPSEFTDVIAISQMTPGPIGINSATSGWLHRFGTIFAIDCGYFRNSAPLIYHYDHPCPVFLFICGEINTWNTLSLDCRPVVIGLIGAAAVVLMTDENFIDYISFIIFGAVFLSLTYGEIYTHLPDCQ